MAIQPISIIPIGIIHSACKERSQTPRQPFYSEEPATIEIYPPFEACLKDLEQFSHIMVFYYMNQIPPEELSIPNGLDKKGHGLFSSRSPVHPNPIGISIVNLEKIEGNILHIRNADMMDGTLVFDLKPYIPQFDNPEKRGQAIRIGYYEQILSK